MSLAPLPSLLFLLQGEVNKVGEKMNLPFFWSYFLTVGSSWVSRETLKRNEMFMTGTTTPILLQEKRDSSLAANLSSEDN